MSISPTPPASSPAGTQEQEQEQEHMPKYIFVFALFYLILLLVLFAIYTSSPTVRNGLPHTFGKLPAGIVWFGALGAVLKSLYGIFTHNGAWDGTFNTWHLSRPFIGAVTGSMGAVIYLVLLELGNQTAVTVDTLTFDVAAFAFGFADSAFLQVLQNITNILIKPGNKTGHGAS
jgi:uncharacterized integral membrane protein